MVTRRQRKQANNKPSLASLRRADAWAEAAAAHRADATKRAEVLVRRRVASRGGIGWRVLFLPRRLLSEGCAFGLGGRFYFAICIVCSCCFFGFGSGNLSMLLSPSSFPRFRIDYRFGCVFGFVSWM